MKTIKAIYELKIESAVVTKHRVGENSTFNSTLSKEFFFMATIKFNTGSVVKLMMVEPRKEYENIPTLEVSYKDREAATKQAFEEYNRVYEIINSDKFLYSRAKDSGCNLYGGQADSPTGVTLMGGCSSFQLADYIAGILGKSKALSPTEDLRTAH